MSEDKNNQSKKQELILGEPDMLYIPDLDVNSIVPNPRNPMVMGEKVSSLLVENIKRGGFITVITVWKPENSDKYQIIDGEHRWRAMMALGHKAIPALLARHVKTQAQADYFLLMLNRIKGHFEQNLLGQMVSDLDKSFEAISELTGYDRDLIDAMTRLIPVEKVSNEDFDVNKKLSEMDSQASKVADEGGLRPQHPIYEENPTSLFMVNVPTNDFVKLNEIINKIKEKEDYSSLADLLLKVFENYASKLE